MAAVFNYGTIFLLARLLDQEAFANYLYIVAWGMIGVLVIDIAADQCLVHFSSAVEHAPLDIWGRLIGLKLIVLAVFSTFGLALEAGAGLKFPIEFALLVLPAFYLGPVYEAQQRNVEYAAVMFAERAIILLSALVIVWAEWEVWAIFVAYFLTSTASLIFQIWRQPFSKLTFKSGGYWRPYLTSYLPVYLVLLAQLSYGNLSRLIIEAKLGVAVFAATTLALQIINLMSLVQTQLDKHLRPALIQAAMRREASVIVQYTMNYFVYYLLPLAAGALCLSLFAAPLMGLLLGERWEAAGHPLRMLSPLIVTVACLRFLDILVVAMDLRKFNLLVNLSIAASLNLTLIFIPAGLGLNIFLIAIVVAQILHVSIIFLAAAIRVRKTFFES